MLPCEATTTHLVRAYVEAYNKGDVVRLDRRVFAREPRFAWYSDAGRLDAAAEDRSTLRAYFAARHRAGDSFTLLRFKYNGYDRARRLGHFEMTLRRTGGPTIPAKGAVSCAARRIVVTSLGG
jgi:hypothetical protein